MSTYEEDQAKEKASRARLFANNKRLEAIINPLRRSTYSCDVDWRGIGRALAQYGEDYGGIDLCPDFQRGHVWTEAQQVHYVENALRGVVPQSAFVIQLNCPNWEDDAYSGDLPHGMQCIDGLQRLTSVQRIMDEEIKPFGLSIADLNHSSYSLKGSTYRFRVEMFSFQTRADLLKHYIDLNSGGTPHSPEEIERVKNLLKSNNTACEQHKRLLGEHMDKHNKTDSKEYSEGDYQSWLRL